MKSEKRKLFSVFLRRRRRRYAASSLCVSLTPVPISPSWNLPAIQLGRRFEMISNSFTKYLQKFVLIKPKPRRSGNPKFVVDFTQFCVFSSFFVVVVSLERVGELSVNRRRLFITFKFRDSPSTKGKLFSAFSLFSASWQELAGLGEETR